MSVWLRSIATAVPALSLDQESAARVAQGFCVLDEAQRRKLLALYRRSGVENRNLSLLVRDAAGEVTSRFPVARDADDRGPGTAQRMALYAEAAPRLALEAARGALDQAALPGRAITHLVTVSCTGFDAPGFDIALIKGLDLPSTVRRTHVGFQIKNLNNPKIGLDEEELRQRLVAGVSYEPYDGVTTSFEFNNQLGEDLQYRGGLEMTLVEGFALRAGVVTGPNKLTGGFGYTFENIGVNYGFSTGGGVLDSTHHFGLQYAWGGEAK